MTPTEIVIASSKLRALIWPLDQYANQAAALIEDHPELLPELEVANLHVAEGAAAIFRAHEVLSAKLDAEVRLVRRLNVVKGMPGATQ